MPGIHDGRIFELRMGLKPNPASGAKKRLEIRAREKLEADCLRFDYIPVPDSFGAVWTDELNGRAWIRGVAREELAKNGVIHVAS